MIVKISDDWVNRSISRHYTIKEILVCARKRDYAKSCVFDDYPELAKPLKLIWPNFEPGGPFAAFEGALGTNTRAVFEGDTLNAPSN